MAEEGFIEKGKKKVSDLVEKVIPIPSADPSVHSNISKGATKKDKQKVLVADLVVEGNPLLKTNEIVTVSNVAKRHAGNWFVEKVVHDISVGSTYTCTASLNKNGTNKATNSSNKASGKTNKSQGDKKPDSKKKMPIVYVDVNGEGPERKVYK